MPLTVYRRLANLPSHIDLSDVITGGMTTYPGLPTPLVADHLTREAAGTFTVRAYATVS